MVINGTDYSLYIIVFLTVIFLVWLEYLICLKAKNPSMRKVLFFIPFIVFVIALVVYGSESGGGFIDMRGAIAVLLVLYGAICAVAIGLGWLIYRLKHRKEIPDSCPFTEE